MFLLWWTVGAWGAYTVAGEKKPWLMVHMALPMCMEGGWWFGRVVCGIDWTKARQSSAIWLVAAPAAITFAAITVWTRLPGGGRSLDALAATMQWIVAALVVAGVGYGIWLGVQRIGWPDAARLSMVGLAGLLLALTIRFSFMLTYINYDMATEYLVYAHATPDIKRMLAEIDLISERTVGGRDIVVAYDDETSWPLSWYMRLYPNARFYGSNPTSDSMSAAVVIVGPKNYEKVRPYVARDYVKRVYRQMWWPDQGYFDITWSRFVDTLRDPDRLKRIWEIVFYRRYPDEENPSEPRDLTKWPTRKEMELYVRKDLAEQIWDLNVVPLTQMVDPQESLIQQRTVDLPAVATIGGVIDGLPVLTPRAVAVAIDGRRVIADTGNHRIVIAGANGDLLTAFGGQCRLGEGAAGGCVDPDGSGALDMGDGQFNEPWGVAVDSQGRIFVADTWNGRIQVFDAEGRFVRKWGVFNTTNGELGDPYVLFGPRGIAVDAAGNLLVADTGNKRILQFTVDGELVRQVGGGGVLIGRFEEPTSVAVDPRDGSIFVADAWNRRIQKLSATLEPLAEWPVTSWGSQHLYYKPYIAVTGIGDVYVTDPENFRVLVYNNAGGLKAAFGSFGVEMNRFGLPNGIAWDAVSGLILVADADNQRVQVLSPVP
jgi:DNA-binding beta-propeller fold protein YncE